MISRIILMFQADYGIGALTGLSPTQSALRYPSGVTSIAMRSGRGRRRRHFQRCKVFRCESNL